VHDRFLAERSNYYSSSPPPEKSSFLFFFDSRFRSAGRALPRVTKINPVCPLCARLANERRKRRKEEKNERSRKYRVVRLAVAIDLARARAHVCRPSFRASAGGLIINRFELSIAVIAPSMLPLFAPCSEHRCTPIFRSAWMHDRRRHHRGHSTCARAYTYTRVRRCLLRPCWCYVHQRVEPSVQFA